LIARIERLLAGGGLDAYELYFAGERSSHVESRDGSADYVREYSSRGWALRVFRDSRMGFSYTLSDDEESVKRMVEGAFFGARYGEEDPHHGIPDRPECFPEIELALEDDPPSADEKVKFAVELEKLTRSVDSRVRRVRYSTIRESLREVSLHNSGGLNASYKSSLYVAFVYAVAEDGDQSETGFGMASARRFSELMEKMEKVASDAALRAVRMLGARRIKTGKYPVVIENHAVVDIIDVLLPSFSAKQVVLGRSALSGKLGDKIFSSLLTIRDDPLTVSGTASRPFDDEGVPSRKIELVREGVVTSYLADTLFGRKLGSGSTGSARRRGVKTPPEVAPSNVILVPGETSVNDMLREMGRGVLLTGFLGMHTADPISGDFSVGAQGLYFEGGELKYPVRTFAVSGNIFELMKRIVHVGNDFEMFGSIGVPSMAFEYMDIGGE